MHHLFFARQNECARGHLNALAQCTWHNRSWCVGVLYFVQLVVCALFLPKAQKMCSIITFSPRMRARRRARAQSLRNEYCNDIGACALFAMHFACIPSMCIIRRCVENCAMLVSAPRD
jgi:hypothetical protein